MSFLFLIACADPYVLPEDSVFAVRDDSHIDSSDSMHGESSGLSTSNNESAHGEEGFEESDVFDEGLDDWDYEEQLESFESTSEELVLVELINKYRKEKDLTELSLVPQASLLARVHSENMAYGDIGVSHEDYDERFSCLISELPIQAMAENVGLAQLREHPLVSEDAEDLLLFEQFKGSPFFLDEASVRTLQVLVDNWVESEDHEFNILGDFEWTGVGLVVAPHPDSGGTSFFATQIFLRPD
ncbi:MAG: hypothetical protein CMK59_12610 [Proteobacteria bacterium]|nr:hypothetical protein [Pseudomonadota bacterium]